MVPAHALALPLGRGVGLLLLVLLLQLLLLLALLLDLANHLGALLLQLLRLHDLLVAARGRLAAEGVAALGRQHALEAPLAVRVLAVHDARVHEPGAVGLARLGERVVAVVDEAIGARVMVTGFLLLRLLVLRLLVALLRDGGAVAGEAVAAPTP